MNLLKNTKQVAVLALLFATAANAQVKPSRAEGGHVGGGDPNELANFVGLDGVQLDSWYAVKQDLINGILMGRASQLDLGSIPLDYFSTTALDTLRMTKVMFDHEKIVVEGTPRPCENFHNDVGVKKIHCNVEDYIFVMANSTPETQYKFVAHEYFGAAGLEPNRYGVSDYPLSLQISDSLSQVVVKRWAVKTDTKPTEQRRISVQKVCPANINLNMHHMDVVKSDEFADALASKGYLITTENSNIIINFGGNLHSSSSGSHSTGTFIDLKRNGHTLYENHSDIQLPEDVSIYLGHEFEPYLRRSAYDAIQVLPACDTFKSLF